MNAGHRNVFAAGALLLFVAAAYSNSFQGSFVYDDFISIVNNEQIREFASSITGTSRPLTNLSFYFHVLLGQNHIAYYHVVNLAIHLLNTVLVYGLFRALTRRKYAANSQVLAFASALLWGLHPLHTESVTYVVQRAEILSAFFLLGGLLAGIGFMHGRCKRCMIAAPVLFVLGYLAKPTAVAGPLLLLMLDAVCVSEGLQQSWRRNWRLHAFCLSTLILPLILLTRSHESTTSAGFQMKILNFWQYLASQPGIIWLYLGKILWPRHLVIDYGADIEHSLLKAGGLSLLLLVTAGVCWRAAKKEWMVTLGALWFLFALLPVILVPLADLVAEHRVYLASAGVALIFCVLLFRGLRHLLHSPTTSRYAFLTICGLTALLLGSRTWSRNCDYAAPLELWEQAVEENPSNIRAHLGVGRVLAAEGKLKEAEGAFRAGAGIYKGLHCEFLKESFRTDYAYACRNLAVVLKARGEGAEASRFEEEASATIATFQ